MTTGQQQAQQAFTSAWNTMQNQWNVAVRQRIATLTALNNILTATWT